MEMSEEAHTCFVTVHSLSYYFSTKSWKVESRKTTTSTEHLKVTKAIKNTMLMLMLSLHGMPHCHFNWRWGKFSLTSHNTHLPWLGKVNLDGMWINQPILIPVCRYLLAVHYYWYWKNELVGSRELRLVDYQFHDNFVFFNLY